MLNFIFYFTLLCEVQQVNESALRLSIEKYTDYLYSNNEYFQHGFGAVKLSLDKQCQKSFYLSLVRHIDSRSSAIFFQDEVPIFISENEKKLTKALKNNYDKRAIRPTSFTIDSVNQVRSPPTYPMVGIVDSTGKEIVMQLPEKKWLGYYLHTNTINLVIEDKLAHFYTVNGHHPHMKDYLMTISIE